MAPKKRDAPPVVRVNDTEYRIISDLTERERFEAERLSGRTINEIPGYTAVLLMAYFTLKRTGIQLTFDEFLDGGDFEIGEETLVPTKAPEPATKPSSEVVDIATAGNQR